MNRKEIIEELESMASNKIFFTVILRLAALNLNAYLDEIENRDHWELLNQNEISFLFGLWLKHRDDQDETLTDVDALVAKIHKLMDDLHMTFLGKLPDPALIPKFEDAIETSLNFQESIFYSGTGAYDYQFLENLTSRYKYDKNWILKKKGIDLSDCSSFYMVVKSIANFKLNFKNYDKGAVEICTIKKNCFIFKDHPQFLKIIDLFSLKPHEKINQNFGDIGDQNELNLRPIIDMGDYIIIPFLYLLAEAFYESPFYWMNEDSNYKDVASTNRGTRAEEIVEEEIIKIFPKDCIYSNVFIIANKTKRITDLDVCILYKGILIAFQIKSKKLTQLSKKGNLTQIKSDYKKAVEESYQQAQKAFKAIEEGHVKLVDDKGNNLIDISLIKEMYSVCIVLDNYAPISIHSSIFHMGKSDMPVAMTIFDFQVIVKYLNSPEMFIAYIIQRVKNASKIMSDTELAFLRFFMTQKTLLPEGHDFSYIQSEFAQFFDRDYYLQLMAKYESQSSEYFAGIGRNDGCFCGSGKKYKNCCMLFLNDH